MNSPITTILWSSLLTTAFLMIWVIIIFPDQFGGWLGKIDQGRYGWQHCPTEYEYDYTLDLE